MDCISMDLEHAIFNDLIKEVVQNLISSCWIAIFRKNRCLKKKSE
jgi:hypothetical protein